MVDGSGQDQSHSTTKPASRRLPVWMRGGPWLAALAVALVALGFYAASSAPRLTLAFGSSDGGELAVAVHSVGIPHPTGYPTYVLLAQAARLFPWGTLAGRLSLFSALAAALAVGLVALAAVELFPGEEQRFPALVAALTAGLALTTAGLFWSQAVVVEVYTLHTCFLALAIWLLLRWRRRGGASLPLAGLALGLGLGNHVSLAFGVAGAVAFLLVPPWRPRRRGKGEALSAAASPGRLGEGSGARSDGETGERKRPAPTSPPPQPGPGFFLVRAGRRPTRRELLWALGLFLAGLLVYLYLPLRAAAAPWLNWDDPRTLAAFWEHVTGAAYRRYLFQVPLAQAFSRLSAVANLLLRDFALRAVLLGLAGAILLGRRDRATLLLLGIPAGLGLLLALTYGGADSYVHLLPFYVAVALWSGVAAGMAAVLLRGRWGPKVALAALLLPLLGVPFLARGWGQWNLRKTASQPVPGSAALAEAPPDSILLTNVDEHTFPLWYLQVVEGARPDIAVVDVRLLEWAWYRQQLPGRYPGLVVPETGEEGWLQALLEANAGRPALTLGPVPLPEGYLLRNAGSLFEVVPPSPSPPC